jgi:adenylosuccinate lyase
VGRSIENLPAQERITYYKSMAADAQRQKQSARTEEQAAKLLSVAARWTALAEDVERHFERLDHMPSPAETAHAARSANGGHS